MVIQAGESIQPTRIEQFAQRVTSSRVGRLAYRCRRTVPFVSFALGAGSFFLVERQAQLAQ